MDYFEKIERQLANKSAKYWARIRTDLGLFARSKEYSDDRHDAIKSELSAILDSGVINYPPTLTELGLGPDLDLKQRRAALGVVNKEHLRTDNEEAFLRDMLHKADMARKSNWAWRIGNEAEDKRQLGWFPFFVTLTIDPNRYEPKQVWQEGREFRKYIRRLAKVVCKELGHPPPHKKPYRPESDYVTYAGVIEHGKSREHHHGHFVIWLRAIPASWRVCPNHGIRNPANRTLNECRPMRTLWTLSLPGLSPALYFRTVGDIWSTDYNFVLPLVNGQPMRISDTRTAGVYITKYLAKEHKEWHHRMKATRNLGMNKLHRIIRQLPQNVVEALTWRPQSSSQNLSLMMTHTVPQGLLRSTAKRQLYYLKFKSRRLDFRTLLQRNCAVFTRMLKAVQRGARPERMNSLDFFDFVSRFLPEDEGFCERRLFDAHEVLKAPYPPDPNRVNHIKLGGNDIGHS